MQKTKPLSFLKNRLPSLHQPLPLNNHDSKRLLDALTTSFRRQLDKEHGWLPDERTPTRPGTATSLLPPLPRPTDHHLSHILSNPLFNPTPTPDPTDGRVARHNAVFDEAVRKGMMTPARASGFLISVKNAILQSPMSSVEEGMRKSGAGARVVGWLATSGLEKELNPFIADSLLVKFMVAEGMEERIWIWLERLRDSKEHSNLWAKLLGVLVSTKSKGAVSLDGAYAAIIRGEEYFRVPKGMEFVQGMLPTWRVLSYQSTVKAWKYETPSATLFDPYVAMLDHMKQDAPLDRAHLDLHHPVNPRAERAVELLTKDVGPEDSWKRVLATAGTSLGQSVYHLMALGLDTVQHLSKGGHSAEAQQILDIVQTRITPLFQSYQRKAALTAEARITGVQEWS
ncbi:hypothetical protein DL546_000839 [Coniochaeta pulveracea]|uniref:Uncharacterized protein n=1 Tax=Coniochaeta pulveracea TaxID=177199 RepID=A0A420YHV3_9PEZI|nr:hypothetical protein DL546_000839 [Coniochaeta pulveracea]